MAKEKVLFITMRNASRSQMVEGFFRNFYGDDFDVYSAGGNPQEINPIAVQVMAEVGIDISQQTSNSLKDYNDLEFDYVVTICGNEYNACPFFLGGKKYFRESLRDIYPFTGTEAEEVTLLREMRDEIGDWVQDFFNYQIEMGLESQPEEEYSDLEEANSSDPVDANCCDPKDTNCCDSEEISDDCCRPTVPAENKQSNTK